MTRNTQGRRMRIIVGLDLTERSEPAFARAVRLALERSAELTILHAISRDLPEQLTSAHTEYATALVKDHAARAKSSGLSDVTQVIVAGIDYEALAEQAEHARADLIVLGTHHERSVLPDMIGTTVDRLLRLSAKPVLLVKRAPQHRYKRVLVAVDFSVASQKALALTLELFPDAEVLVVNTWGWRRKPAETAAAENPEQNQAHRLALNGLVREAEEAAGQRADGEPRKIFEILETGTPETVIPELAKERLADLIVTGTHARTGLTRFLLGSVAEEIVLRTEADVFVVPPPPTAHAPATRTQKTIFVA